MTCKRVIHRLYLRWLLLDWKICYARAMRAIQAANNAAAKLEKQRRSLP